MFLEEREELIIEQSRQAFLLARRLDENNSDADDEAVLSEAEEMKVDWGISMTHCKRKPSQQLYKR